VTRVRPTPWTLPTVTDDHRVGRARAWWWVALLVLATGCSSSVPAPDSAAGVLVPGIGAGMPIRGYLIEDSTVVLGRDMDGTVERHALPEGSLRWRARVPNWVHNAPAVVGTSVIVSYGDNIPVVSPAGDSLLIVGRDSSGIAAFAVADGTLRWQHATRGAVMTRVVAIADTILAVTGGRALLALDAASGRVLWEIDVGGIGSMATPLLHGRTLVLGLSNPQSVAAVDLDKRAVQWRALIGEHVRGSGDVTPAVLGDTLFTTATQLITGRDMLTLEFAPYWFPKVLMRFGVRPYKNLARQWVTGVSLTDGRVLWSRPVGVGYHRELNRSGTPIAVSDGIIFSSFVTNEVFRIGADGTTRWSTRLPAVAAKGNSAVIGDTVIVALADGRLVSLDAGTGRVVGLRQSAGAVAFFAPLSCRGRLWYPTEDGRMVAVGPVNTSHPECGRAPQ
jgi:outer membrane protein assembly factor BamB